MRRFNFLTLAVIESLSLSCKMRQTSQSEADSNLQDVKMTFPLANLPWKDSVDDKARKAAIASFKITFSAAKTSTNQKCTEIEEKNAGFNGTQTSVSIPKVRLTKNCEYKMLVKILDPGLTYFQTADSSLTQKITGPVIKGFKICLANEGSLFDSTKASTNCVTSNDSGDVDVVINADYSGQGGSNSTQTPNFDTVDVDKLLTIAKKFQATLSDILQKFAAQNKTFDIIPSRVKIITDIVTAANHMKTQTVLADKKQSCSAINASNLNVTNFQGNMFDEFKNFNDTDLNARFFTDSAEFKDQTLKFLTFCQNL